jgi:SnoaL-like domain
MTIDPATLADRLAVEERIYMYAHLLDSQQYHRIADEVFTEDGDIDFGGQRAHGRAEIEARVMGNIPLENRSLNANFMTLFATVRLGMDLPELGPDFYAFMRNMTPVQEKAD